MADYFEIDFLDVESDKSGDAIAVRYELAGKTTIHVVDAGFQSTGDTMVDHINQRYGNPEIIDHVVVTHSDGDHAGGLRAVLESFNVGTLWMLRPWLYAAELLPRFARYTSVDNLRRRLREIYANLVALEDIAISRGIPIRDPFQGAAIGAFTVMAPSKARYLDLIVVSEKTPEAVEQKEDNTIAEALRKAAAKIVNLVRASWGDEVFSTQETSAENEMSIIQYAQLCGKKNLLTGDAGRGALKEAADFAPRIGLVLPGIDNFQVPHHGSRRNVSTELLDRWLGSRLESRPGKGFETFTAIVSSAKADEHHPRRAVKRAMIHRGAKLICTEGVNLRVAANAPQRSDYHPCAGEAYPEDQEAA